MGADKNLFKNSAYEPNFTRPSPQASLAKPTQPLKCYWTQEQDPNNNNTTHAAETHTTRLLAPKNGQAGF
jgi:glucose dehydrogenase